MGLFSSIGKVLSPVIEPIKQIAQEVVHQPGKAIEHLAILPSTQSAGIAQSVLDSGANKIPVVNTILQGAVAGGNIPESLIVDHKLPTKKDLSDAAKGGATLGAVIAGGYGLGAAGALGSGTLTDNLLKKKPGSLNAALSAFGGDYGSLASSFLSDPYSVPEDIAGNPDVETALNNVGVDKARKAIYQSNAANKQSVFLPALIGGAGLLAILLFRRKK